MKTTLRILRTQLTAALCVAYGGVTLASLQCSTAFADEESPPTRTVSFADLDISKPAGVQTLYHRIEAAARQVCQLGVVSDKHLLGKEQACFKQAVDGAVKSVNSIALANLRAGTAPRLASR